MLYFKVVELSVIKGSAKEIEGCMVVELVELIKDLQFMVHMVQWFLMIEESSIKQVPLMIKDSINYSLG